MVCTRFWRQAHTWGLTYCTVGMPARRRSRASRRLNSGASMPTNTSGFASMNERRTRARNRNKRGRSRRISNKPMTASDSEGSQTSHPADCIFGPATPKNSTSGASRRSAWINPAPSVSPDASPATRPTRSVTLELLPNDAARAAPDEIDEGADLGLGGRGFVELLQSRFQFEAGAVEHAVGATNIENL